MLTTWLIRITAAALTAIAVLSAVMLVWQLTDGVLYVPHIVNIAASCMTLVALRIGAETRRLRQDGERCG